MARTSLPGLLAMAVLPLSGCCGAMMLLDRMPGCGSGHASHGSPAPEAAPSTHDHAGAAPQPDALDQPPDHGPVSVNTHCPIRGEPVSDAVPPVDHRGSPVGFCCEPCLASWGAKTEIERDRALAGVADDRE